MNTTSTTSPISNPPPDLEIFAALKRPDKSGRPKYQRLSNALVEAIKRGVWRPGDRLPAEETLAELTPFSLGTVQRSLRDLVDQGLVVRQHGLGSFVADKPRELQDPWHCRFVDDDGETVLPVYTRALRREAEEREGPWRHALEAEAQVIRLDRSIVVNNEFTIFSRFYADRNLLTRIWEVPLRDLDGANFRRLIVNECHLPITEITRQVTIMPFDEETCAVIGLPPGSTGMRLRAIGRAGRMGVYYQEFFIPPTHRPLEIPENHLDD